MDRIVIGLHTVSVLIAYGVLGLLWLFPQRTSHTGTLSVVARWIVVTFAASGFITGLALMAKRSGRSESIILAISTVAAFLLLFLLL